LTSTAGLPAVRTQAAQRLEMWLSNQKLVRPATDLLLAICVNCSTETPTDTDVLNALLRLRLKVVTLSTFLLKKSEIIIIYSCDFRVNH
jgi:integrator complex subunit 1